jgi:hypothetical protein
MYYFSHLQTKKGEVLGLQKLCLRMMLTYIVKKGRKRFLPAFG